MRVFRLLLFFALLVGGVWALGRSWGTIPPLGPLLDPFAGLWQSAADTGLPGGDVAVEGVSAPVTIRFDERGVPHIFAQSTADAYFAQGYVMARDRLWQMDFMSRVGAGRASEVLGARAVEYDRYQRRIGMAYGAERLADFVLKNDTSRVMVESFAAGVNEWMASLTPAEYPIEYKLLGFEPETWSPIKTMSMLMNMRYDMTGGSSEHNMLKTLQLKGHEFMDTYFANEQPWVDPIVPKGTPWNFDPVRAVAPDSFFYPKYMGGGPAFRNNPANGSNNWALAGSKTATGKPLLANDPHLTLNMPAIWHEVQLTAPGLNVYGVSLVGIPGVVIGFNESLAWGLTNTGADVFDWYEITWQDSTRSAYWHDGQWKAPTRRTEVIHVKSGADVVDEVIYTHHGPVVLQAGEDPYSSASPPDHALRWVAHEASNELLTIYLLNRSAEKGDIEAAIRHFKAPAQNVVYATHSGDIGIVSNGALPVRWEGQGKYPSDGSDPRYDWPGFIPFEQLPQIHNPDRGFVSSANQHPADPAEYPYFLDDRFESYERGARINQRLAGMVMATPDSMVALQLDDLSLHAASLLPRMLQGVAGWSPDSMDTAPYQQFLASWDYRFNPDAGAAALFNRWWAELNSSMWSDEFPRGQGYTVPSRDRIAQALLAGEGGEWIDDQTTPVVETLDDLLKPTLVRAIRFMQNQQGTDDAAQWDWVTSQNVNIPHLLGLEPFGRYGLRVGGCNECVNSLSGSHGPSWRMVVSLEDPVQAWGVFPGGPSGLQSSKYYDNTVEAWARGNPFPLWLLTSPDDRPDLTPATFLLKPRP